MSFLSQTNNRESNSESNRINCSERAAKILKQQSSTVSLTSRGEVFIKGKGNMECFWVNEKGAENAALQRVKASQRLKMLEMQRGTKAQLEDDAIPEQCPEASSTHMPVVTGSASPSDEFAYLEGNLKERLGRVGNGLQASNPSA